MAAPAPAAAGAPIDLDATVARLRALPTPQKISLSGALAVLICVDTCVSDLRTVRARGTGQLAPGASRTVRRQYAYPPRAHQPRACTVYRVSWRHRC